MSNNVFLKHQDISGKHHDVLGKHYCIIGKSEMIDSKHLSIRFQSQILFELIYQFIFVVLGYLEATKIESPLAEQ